MLSSEVRVVLCSEVRGYCIVFRGEGYCVVFRGEGYCVVFRGGVIVLCVQR